jgi:HlyD family secretion protein
MTANAELIREEKKGVLLVPEAAVVYDKDRKTFLELPDPAAEGGKRKIAAQLGISNGIKTEVLSAGALKAGDKVVLQ